MQEIEGNESLASLCQEWLEATMESIADGVIATDSLGAVTVMNAAAERLTGRSLAEAHKRAIEETMVIRRRSTGEAVECPIRQVLRGETIRAEDALPDDAILVRRDGSTRAIADSVAEIREPSGALSGAVIVFRDVTAKVRELERLSFLSQASGEMNASLDYEVTLSTVARLAVPVIADGCAVLLARNGDVTALATAHVDAAKDERLRELLAPPRPCRTIPAIDPGEPTLISELTDAVAAQLDEECSTLLRTLDVKSYITVPLNRGAKSLGAIVLFSSDRRFDKSDLGVAIALAERAAIAIENARLFHELSAARAEADSRRIEAELANRAKDEFLAVLGHELRNPLAPIATALDLMRLRSDGSHVVTIVDRQVKHLTRLVDDLLDISRITRAKLVLSKARIDLAEVIANGIDLANPLLERNRQLLSVSIAPDMWVDGDPVRLAQVVSNLLNNAAKYSDPGARISIRAERQEREVVLSVRDEGIGIDASVLPRIFEPFVQQPQGLDRAEGGLGLGLAIVRGIVQVHAGTVSARSDGSGRGTEIVVRLPAQPRPVVEELADGRPRWPTTQRRTRVLVVDDNRDALMLLAELLGYLGYDVVYAHDATSALQLARSARPSIALIDIGLPGMDGYQLARELRKIDELDDLKLVAVTGYGLESDRARSTAAGFDRHLVKPVAMDTLQSTLARFTGEEGGSEAMVPG